MLQSIKHIYGDEIGASDGEVGHVKDFYFDDKLWIVRYVVAETGNWLTERKVLIAPHAIASIYQGGHVMIVRLTRKQIEDSPSIDTHRPVSRQDEEEYYQYYGWPYYWQGDGISGMSGFPLMLGNTIPNTLIPPETIPHKNDDIHLRSTQAVKGYQIQLQGEIVGEVADFLIDDQSWVISNLVINTGGRHEAKNCLLVPTQVDRIDWEDSKVYLNISKTEFQAAPLLDSLPASRE